jgi:hypothetical protein
MNKDKRFAAGLIALSLPLMMLAISSPGANAATVASSVDAIDVCEWQMASAPTSIGLTSPTVYEGAALSVSSSISNLTVGLSGSQSSTALSGTSTDCSFYNNRETADVTFALTTTDLLTATYGPGAGIADPAMNFDLATGGGLDIVTDLTNCTDYTATPLSFTAVTSATRAFGLEAGFVANKYFGNENGSERCTPEITIGLDIKASNTVPAGAGQNYSFAGPTLVIALATVNVGE